MIVGSLRLYCNLCTFVLCHYRRTEISDILLNFHDLINVFSVRSQDKNRRCTGKLAATESALIADRVSSPMARRAAPRYRRLPMRGGGF